MSTARQKTITEYMNARCSNRQFIPLEIAVIETQKDFEARHRNREEINFRSRQGKRILNQRIADMANKALMPKVPITHEHIQLYKRCWMDEYSYRTGKCIWGFAEIRRQNGYDPITGLEIS